MEAADIRRLVAIRDTVAALLLAEATRQGVTVDEHAPRNAANVNVRMGANGISE